MSCKAANRHSSSRNRREMEAQGLRTWEQLLGVQRTVGLLWGQELMELTV